MSETKTTPDGTGRRDTSASSEGAAPAYARARSVDFNEIPLIDLGGMDDSPEHRQELGERLVRTARDVGFFYVGGHGIERRLASEAIDASRRFFELGESDKSAIGVDVHQRGWMAQGLAALEGSATHDAKEVFFWGREVDSDDEQVRAGLPLVHPNQWPDKSAPYLRPAVLAYYDAVMSLGRNMLHCIALGLGGDPGVFERAYDKPLGRGQLVYYPAIEDADVRARRFGAAPHTDFGVLTILRQDGVGGLQVRNRSGAWIEAPPIEDTFVCNIGDLLERWTNGRLTSTAHRVINSSGRSRYSIPIFCDPSSDTRIDPRDFDSNADQDAPEAVLAGEYIAGKNRRNFAHYDEGKKV